MGNINTINIQGNFEIMTELGFPQDVQRKVETILTKNSLSFHQAITSNQKNFHELFLHILSNDDYNKILLYNLKPYIQYFENNKNEFTDFGIIFGEENGKEIVDLKKIKSPQKNYLFGILALSSLRQINVILGHTDSGQIYSISRAQDILKIFFELLGYRVILEKKEKVKLSNLQDYETYFQKNKDDFTNFGININENQINLDNIPDLKKTLFGTELRTSLKNLGKILGFSYNIHNKNEAKEILKAFFEKIGYTVTNFSLTPTHLQKKISPLHYFEGFLETSMNDFLNFGIKFYKKNVNLNNIKNTAQYNLFGCKAYIGLKNLALTLNMNFTDCIFNKTDAQDILKTFFEKIGYNVILEKKEKIFLKNFEDHKQYFYKNKKEFYNFGVIFDEKKVYLNKIQYSKKTIFGKRANISLRKLSNICGQKREKIVNSIADSQKILEIFFKKLGYEVFYEISTKENQETLEDYEKYFEKNIQEFINFGIIFGEADEQKTIDLSKIVGPDGNFLFGKTARNSLRNLGQLLDLNYNTYITKKVDAQIILKTFFEKIGYSVILKLEKKSQLITFEDYEQYYYKNQIEFQDYGIIFGEKNGIKTVDLQGIQHYSSKKIFGKTCCYSLNNIQKIMIGKNDKVIMKKDHAQKILALFFAKIGYKILLINSQIFSGILKDPLAVKDIDSLDKKQIANTYEFLELRGYTLNELQERSHKKLCEVFQEPKLTHIIQILETNITDTDIKIILGIL